MFPDILDSIGRKSVRRCCKLALLVILLAAGADASGGIDPRNTDEEMSISANPAIQALLELGETAERAELCFFDSADTGVGGFMALTATGWDARALSLERPAENHIFGWFIRAQFEGSGETAYSDTLFSTWEALSHSFEATILPAKTLGTDGTSDSHAGKRAHNYPNPFNPNEENTRIVFEPDRDGSLTLLIFDLFGHLVYKETGAVAADLSWDGRNGRGELVDSGGYVCILKIAGEQVSKHKIAVIK